MHSLDPSKPLRSSPQTKARRAEPAVSKPLAALALSAHGRPFPLQNVRTLDFSWFLASAGGARFAAALGAESKNSGERGVSLNIRHPKGLEIARRLVAISDIVAEGFCPGVLDRLGLGMTSSTKSARTLFMCGSRAWAVDFLHDRGFSLR